MQSSGYKIVRIIVKISTALMVVVFLCSCATPLFSKADDIDAIPIPYPPAEANKYEGIVRYKCGDKPERWVWGGTSSCQVAEKYTLKIHIKVPKNDGQVVVRSGRKEVIKDFNKNSWVSVDWKFEDHKDSVPIVFSVAGRGSGIQLGKIYPYVNTKKRPKMTLPVRFWCFEQSRYVEAEGNAACQQPQGAVVEGHFTPKKQAGKYLISTAGCSVKAPRGDFTAEAKPIRFEITKALVGNCAAKIAVKYEDKTYQEAELYLDFWESLYVPLSPPRAKLEKKGVEFCAPQEYKFTELNGNQRKKGWFIRTCKSVNWHKGWAWAIAWDASGRCSYDVRRKQ